MLSEEPRFAPNGNKLPERLPVGHRLVDTTKQQWLIGPSIGCGGFGDIYLTRQYDENASDLKRLTQEQIIKESATWTNVIKFEHFSGPLFAEINFYLRCARKETIEEYMASKKLKHLGMPRFVASGIYDPLKNDNPLPVCKNVMAASIKATNAKKARQVATNGKDKKANGFVANGKAKRVPANAQTKEKKYRFLVLQRFGDDVLKIWQRAHEHFDMYSAFNIALKVIDTIEYIHSHGYVHADIKASNLLIECNNRKTNLDSKPKDLTNGNAHRQSSVDSGNGSIDDNKTRASRSRSIATKRERPKSIVNGGSEEKIEASPNEKSTIEPSDQIYLIDFGLVERFYSKDGTHREHVEDQRRANNGTVEFSSRDAHIGAFARRSDLESLAYNLLYWVSGGRLPWTHVSKDHQLVEASKKWYMDNLEIFVNYCFNEDAYPIDPLKLLKGLDPTVDSPHPINGRVNGRLNIATSTNVKNGKAEPATNTKVRNSKTTTTTTTEAKSTSRTQARSAANTVKVSKGKAPLSASSSSSSTSSSSTQDSIMCAALYDFLSYISKLRFEDEPDYHLLKSILSNALGGGSAARTARKRGSGSVKKTPPKQPECEKLTPAMREILLKMKMNTKKR